MADPQPPASPAPPAPSAPHQSLPPEPDIGRLVAMVAGAALSAIAMLAAVATLPIGWILLASLFPVLLWAILLREIHRLLRFRGEEPVSDAARDDRWWHL